jgi:hypothetical protein
VDHYGNFTANFKELPPPLPKELWATLFGFILTTVLGAWIIPTFIRGSKSNTYLKKFNYFYKKITSYKDKKLLEKDIESLDILKNDITDAYSKGKIKDEHYNMLKKVYKMVMEKSLDLIQFFNFFSNN